MKRSFRLGNGYYGARHWGTTGYVITTVQLGMSLLRYNWVCHYWGTADYVISEVHLGISLLGYSRVCILFRTRVKMKISHSQQEPA